MFFLSNTWACFNRKNMLLLVLFSILLLAGCGNSTAFPLTQFAIPTAESGPDVITVGPDKALWFTEHRARKIGRITVQGQLTEFALPQASNAAGFPSSMTVGPDGALWFAEDQDTIIGRITVQGQITTFTLPKTAQSAADLTKGPDGALWFTEGPTGTSQQINKIGRITVQGRVSEFVLPYKSSVADGVSFLTAGPDGALWFTVFMSDQMGRITVGGTVTMFNEPTKGDGSPGDASSIITGPDGALWVTEFEDNQIGRIRPSQS